MPNKKVWSKQIQEVKKKQMPNKKVWSKQIQE